jgi:hypothetical protein
MMDIQERIKEIATDIFYVMHSGDYPNTRVDRLAEIVVDILAVLKEMDERIVRTTDDGK